MCVHCTMYILCAHETMYKKMYKTRVHLQKKTRIFLLLFFKFFRTFSKFWTSCWFRFVTSIRLHKYIKLLLFILNKKLFDFNSINLFRSQSLESVWIQANWNLTFSFALFVIWTGSSLIYAILKEAAKACQPFR